MVRSYSLQSPFRPFLWPSTLTLGLYAYFALTLIVGIMVWLRTEPNTVHRNRCSVENILTTKNDSMAVKTRSDQFNLRENCVLFDVT